MEKRKSRVFTITFFVILGCILIVAAFFDLQIAKSIYMPENSFAVFFDRIGELPAHLIIPFAAMIFFHACPEKLKKVQVLWQIIFAVLTFYGYYEVFTKFGNKWFVDDGYRLHFEIAFAVIFTALALWLSKYIPESKIKPLSRFALFAVVVGFISNYLVVVIKEIWGRVRFRDLAAESDYSAFTPWYLPQGNTGNRSFPSGHTIAAASSFIIVALSDAFKALKKYELCLFLVAVLVSVCVALSRMLMGAHFLSDVTMSVLISFAFFTGFRALFYRKERRLDSPTKR